MADIDREALLARIPPDRGALYLGVSPWPEDLPGWRRSSREVFEDLKGQILRRTTWERDKRDGARLMIDVLETASPADAIEALVGTLAANQLAALDPGPEDLGLAAYQHPVIAPPAIFVADANLLLTLYSIGPERVDVTAPARAFISRLHARPEAARDAIRLGTAEDEPRAGAPLPLAFELPWALGEDGFVALTSQGGTLAIRDGAPVLSTTGPGAASVEIFALEPGREPLAGALPLDVR